MDGWGSVVVGVLPPTFRIYLPADAGMPTNVDAWGVLPNNIADFARDAPWLTVVTRLRDGVTLEQAQHEMDAVAARLREVHPFHKTQNLQIRVNGMHRDVVNHARPALLALLGAVGFVLLIACANIANLLLVRATERGREIAVRAAVGSGRGRIIAQMLVESTVLSWAGAVLGVLLAWQGIRLITALSPGNLPRIEGAAIDLAALLYTAGAACVAAIVFGLAPALRAVAGNLADALRDRGSDTGGMRGNKLRSAFVVLEVALSLVLLIGAGLMVRSFAQVQRVDPGFDARNVVTFNAPLQFLKYLTSAKRANFANELADRLRAIPGVERVGGVTPLPLAKPWGSGNCRAAPSSVWTTGRKRSTWRSSIGSSRSASSARRTPSAPSSSSTTSTRRRSRSSDSPYGSSESSTTCGRHRSPRRVAKQSTSRTSSTRFCP
jgi:putative ABC transport system permease protein